MRAHKIAIANVKSWMTIMFPYRRQLQQLRFCLHLFAEVRDKTMIYYTTKNNIYRNRKLIYLFY